MQSIVLQGSGPRVHVSVDLGNKSKPAVKIIYQANASYTTPEYKFSVSRDHSAQGGSAPLNFEYNYDSGLDLAKIEPIVQVIIHTWVSTPGLYGNSGGFTTFDSQKFIQAIFAAVPSAIACVLR